MSEYYDVSPPVLRTLGIHHRFQLPQLSSASGEPVLQDYLWGWVYDHLWLIRNISTTTEVSRLTTTCVVIVTGAWFESPIDRRDEGANVEINEQVLVLPCADIS